MSEILQVGEPTTDAQRRAVRLLRDELSGEYQVFHNLDITLGVRPYDIDLVVMAPHAFYVVAVRNETGPISGDALQWWFEGPRYVDSPLDLLERRRQLFELLLERFEHKSGFSAALPVVSLVAVNGEARINDPRADAVVVPLERLAQVISDPSRVPPGRVKALGKRGKLVRNWLRERFQPTVAPTTIGFYRVQGVLGETTDHRAYLAQHQYVGTEAEVKLKVYATDPYGSVEERAELIKQVFRDVTAFRALGDHPSILNATDVFAWQDAQFAVVSRWRQGRYLTGLLSEPTFDAGRRVAAAADVAVAVAHAHEHGVLHRDIRPDNVLVESSGRASLMNFDMARVDHPSVATIVVGRTEPSPYLAPEVVHGGIHAATEASDLFALGVMTHFMLTGEYPSFQDGFPVYPRWRPHPSSASRGPRVEVAEVLRRLCAREPSQRYRTSRQAATDLRTLSSNWT